MLPNTIDAAKAIFRTDPSISASERARLLAILRRGPEAIKQVEPEKQELCIIRRQEAARRMGVSLRAIDTWAKQKILHKIRLPGRTRACGFSSVEIARLASGGGET